MKPVGGSRPRTWGTPATATSATQVTSATRAARVRGASSSHTQPASSAANVTGRARSARPPIPPNPCATASTIRAGGPASASTAAPRGGTARASVLPTNAMAAATAAAGTATRFAGIDANVTSPKVASSTGTTATCAPIVIAARSASRGGSRCGRWARTRGAATSTPAVAVAESTSPSDPANRGSRSTNSRTATASPWRASRGTPRIEAARSTRAIVPARCTLGSNRVTNANHGTTSATATHRPRAPTRASPSRPSTPPSTIATLLPDTAVRCVNPVACIASWSAAGNNRVSPVTNPTSRPPARSSR